MSVVPDHDHETKAALEASVSSWVDGEQEIRPEDLDSPYARQLWETYHLIGDTLRSSDLAFSPSERFYARVSAAVDAEPTIVSPRARRFRSTHWISGLAAIAATVSGVWLFAPGMVESEPELTLAEPQTVAVRETEAEEDQALHDYLDAHQGLAGTLPAQQVSYRGVLP